MSKEQGRSEVGLRNPKHVILRGCPDPSQLRVMAPELQKSFRSKSGEFHMKILMLAPQPFFQPRGTPFSVLHRLKALSQLGHEVDLITYHLGEDVPIAGIRIFRIPRVPFVRHIDVGPSKKKIILDAILALAAIYRLTIKRYEVIHSHEEAGFLGTFLAKMFRSQHLYDMHSSLPQQLRNFRFTELSLFIRLFERLERLTIERADALITICPELRNYVERLVPEKPQALIENVAEASEVFETSKVSVAALRESHGLNGHTVVLYAGTFEPYQGLDLLVEAGAQVVKARPEVSFVLVGGKPDQVEHYVAKVRALHLDNHFTFTGSVAPEKVALYLQMADVVVSPRVQGTNTPLKIYSYLRSGKPIVATRHITHTQVLNDEVAVLTDITPRALAEGILRTLTDEQLRQRVVQNARRLAEERYSYHGYLERTREIYDYLARARQPNPAH